MSDSRRPGTSIADLQRRESRGDSDGSSERDDQQSTNQRRLQIQKAIEGEIIPRLMPAHTRLGDPAPDCAAIANVDLPGDLGGFCKLLLACDMEALGRQVNAMRARGVALEEIYLELFAPAARYLGEQWDADALDFTQVTVGLSSLHHLLREFGAASREAASVLNPARGVLLSPLPGEQHTFGFCLVSEFFRRAGWDVVDEPCNATSELIAAVRRQNFAVIGLSVSSKRSLETIAETIRAIRRRSVNRNIVVLVGGPAFNDRPELATEIGADATAGNGRDAVELAQQLVECPARPS